jgi:heme a synthase
MKLDKFAKYAWFVLIYNLLVIVWGVFLRASKSGDGCGQHWLTCNGDLIPSAPQFKTIIEFSHRLMSGLAMIFVLILLVWAFRKFKKYDFIRKTGFWSFIFILFEAIIGGVLVLTGSTAGSITAGRPFYMAAHLIITFGLLLFLSLTAWFANSSVNFDFKRERKVNWLLAAIVFGMFLVGMSGSTAALSSMLFPANSLAEGISQDFSSSSHILLRLRVLHPIFSVSLSVGLFFFATWLKTLAEKDFWTVRWANILQGLVLLQLVVGGVTLITLAPIAMQLIHLLLADFVWISIVLMSASFFVSKPLKSQIK